MIEFSAKKEDAIRAAADRLGMDADSIVDRAIAKLLAENGEHDAAAEFDPSVLPPARPRTMRIIARERRWNAKGNGEEENRRIKIPGEGPIWASDGPNLDGDWQPRGMLAAQRKCKETVEVPEGTVIVAFDKPYSGGQPRGSAQVTAGIVEYDADKEKLVINWDLPVRRKDGGHEVSLPAGEKVVL